MKNIVLKGICLMILCALIGCSSPGPKPAAKPAAVESPKPPAKDGIQALLKMKESIKNAKDKVKASNSYNKVELQSGGEYSSGGSIKILYLTIHYAESANIEQEQLKQLGKEAFKTVNEIIDNEHTFDKFEVNFLKETGSGVAKKTITRTFDYQLSDL